MDSIFKEYGDAILSAVGAVAIIALLLTGSFGGFNGIMKAMGRNMDVSETAPVVDETVTVLNAAAELPPEICLKIGNIVSGTTYDMNDLFSAEDEFGNVFSTVLIRAYESSDEGQQNAMSTGAIVYDKEKDALSFAHPGIYRLFIRCREMKYADAQFVVTVLEETEEI